MEHKFPGIDAGLITVFASTPIAIFTFHEMLGLYLLPFFLVVWTVWTFCCYRRAHHEP